MQAAASGTGQLRPLRVQDFELGVRSGLLQS